MHRQRIIWFAGFMALHLFWACSGAQTARKSWLQQQLIADNWDLMRRQPDLVAGKFRKMAIHPYNYYRGTVRLYLLDMVSATSTAMPSSFGSFETAFVPSVVDPHPENIGSYWTKDGILTADFNDFDGADYLPFHFDVRRLAVGFVICAHVSKAHLEQPSVIDEVATSVVDGYLTQVQVLSTKGKPLQIRPASKMGKILDDLLRRAGEQGKAQEALTEYTEVKDGKRIFRFGEVESSDVPGVIRKVIQPLSQDEWSLLRELMRDYLQRRGITKPKEQGFYVIKGAARRLGAGVSSYPRLRYYVLVEGETLGVGDDVLLEWKEMADPVSLPDYERYPRKTFRNNGERVVWLQTRLQETTTNDRYLGWALVSPMSFRIRQLTKYQKNFDVIRFRDKLADKKWKVEDLLVFARIAGQLLARSHALSNGLDGRPMLPHLDAILKGNEDAFRKETVLFAKTYAAQILADYKQFAGMLQSEGALLGVRAAPVSLGRL